MLSSALSGLLSCEALFQILLVVFVFSVVSSRVGVNAWGIWDINGG